MTNLIDIEHSIRRLNRFFSFIIIPLLGILIPNISGLISNGSFRWWQLLFSYLYFISLSLLIWKGNMIFFRRIRRKYEQQNIGYFKTLYSYVLVNLLYSAIITGSCLIGWHYVSMDGPGGWKPIIITGTVVMLIVLLINNVYELALLGKEMEETTMQYRNMETAKIQAELEALKAQIDPHFIFNSLNTLSYLISNQPDTARHYNETLANVYRYILINKDKDLVFLEEELDFIRDYFSLMKIRFQEAVRLAINIPAASAEEMLITPVSLQLLLENAIKHNYASRSHPLIITIGLEALYVTVTNNVKQKKFEVSCNGIGLKNLEDRYQLIMQKDIIIMNNKDEFLVKVPVLKT